MAFRVGDTVNIDLQFKWWHMRHGQTVNLVQHVGYFGWEVIGTKPLYVQVRKDGAVANVPVRFVSKAIKAE